MLSTLSQKCVGKDVCGGIVPRDRIWWAPVGI